MQFILDYRAHIEQMCTRLQMKHIRGVVWLGGRTQYAGWPHNIEISHPLGTQHQNNHIVEYHVYSSVLFVQQPITNNEIIFLITEH